MILEKVHGELKVLSQLLSARNTTNPTLNLHDYAQCLRPGKKHKNLQEKEYKKGEVLEKEIKKLQGKEKNSLHTYGHCNL